jgi:hypothetical protein
MLRVLGATIRRLVSVRLVLNPAIVRSFRLLAFVIEAVPSETVVASFNSLSLQKRRIRFLICTHIHNGIFLFDQFGLKRRCLSCSFLLFLSNSRQILNPGNTFDPETLCHLSRQTLNIQFLLKKNFSSRVEGKVDGFLLV